MSRIFISYRRDDSAGYAGRLYDRLSERFGQGQIFMDIDTIELGLDFVEVIEEAVGSCDVLIALIGRQWLAITDAAGRRRLDNPEDFVRLEIATALDRNIRVIPVLVRGATMPRSADLPNALKKLSRRHALEISDTRFHYDVDRLIETLEMVAGVEEGAMPFWQKVPLWAWGTIGGIVLLAVVGGILLIDRGEPKPTPMAGRAATLAATVPPTATPVPPTETPTATPTPTETFTPTATPTESPTPIGPASYELLIAKRDEDSLFVVNQTTEAFPLARLRLGDGEGAINGTDWGVDMLESGACVAAWNDTGKPRPPDGLTCDQVGAHLTRGGGDLFWTEAFNVYYDERPVGICETDQKECSINIPTQESYTLLIAKRDEQGLFVVNWTAEAFPLALLRLGDDQGAINGTDWGIEMLGSGACVVAWNDTGDPQPPDGLTCNQVGTHLTRDKPNRFWESRFNVYYGGQLIGTCAAKPKKCFVSISIK